MPLQPDQSLLDSILAGEPAIGVNAAARLLPVDGHPAAKPTVYRWIHSGRLESAKIGGKTVTTKAAIERFIRSGNAPRTNRTRSTPLTKTPAHLAAVGALSAAGLL